MAVITDLAEATGYGTGDGLCGWNCRHNFFPFFEGIDLRTYRDEDLEKLKNDGYYEAEQQQRKLERDVRATRRELAGYDAAIAAATDDQTRAALQQEFDRASVKLKKQEGKLKDWIKEKELTPDPSRVQAGGFDRSVSQKAVWANKRELTAQKERDTIKAIKSAGIKGEIHLVPKSIDASTLTIDSGHIKERGHNISDDEAKRFIKEAKFSSTVWKGKYERYFSADGAAYVDTETNTIRTAFGKDEYDDVTIAALEEYDKWMNQ